MFKFEGTMFLINLPYVFLALKIADVNWQSKLNKAAHHTSDYTSTEVIVRRGQAFNITLNLQTTVQSADNFTFIATTGNFPMALTSHTSHSSPKTLVSYRFMWSIPESLSFVLYPSGLIVLLGLGAPILQFNLHLKAIDS